MRDSIVLLVDTTINFTCIYIRDGIGHFASIPHFVKIMDACKAAYTNYQVRT